MAKLIPNPAAGELTGTLGTLVFARFNNGKVVVRKRPVRKVASTTAELANQKQFTDAVAYAKRVWANDPDLKARYIAAAKVQDKQGFQLAKADFRRAPKVEEIMLTGYTGQAGESIRITATDDFEVNRVHVTIKHLSGALIEEGPAIQEGTQWVYQTQGAIAPGETVVIEVTAVDHPGHAGVRRVDHACGPRFV